MIKHALSGLKNVFWENDFEAVCLWASINLIGWGIWFAMPWDMRQLGRVYVTFETVLPENGWALVFVCLGFFRILTLALDRYRDTLKWQAVGILFSIFLWTFSFAVYVQSEPRSILVYISTLISLTSIWELIRIMKKIDIRKEVKKGRPAS